MADKQKTGTMAKLATLFKKKPSQHGLPSSPEGAGAAGPVVDKKKAKEEEKKAKAAAKKAKEEEKKAAKKKKTKDGAAAGGAAGTAAPGEKAKGDNNMERQQAKRVNRGRMFVDASMLDSGDGYDLKVKVFDARDLPPTNPEGTSDTFVQLFLTPDAAKDSKRASDPVKGSLAPNFGTTYTWRVATKTDMDNTRVHIQLWNASGKKEFLGGFSFPLADVLDTESPTVGWFKLLDQKKGEIQAVPFRVKKLKEVEEMEDIYGMPEDLVTNVKKPIAKPTPSATAMAMQKVTTADFNFIKMLGQGAFGKVFLAERKGTEEIYAVKALSKEEVVDNDDVGATMTERRVLAVANGCPFLTTVFATFTTPDRLFYVMEFINGGDLMFHLQRENSFPEKQVQFYAAEILIGLWYLHKNGILYRDLKLDNVMIAGDGHVKIADFGMCKENMWGAATTTTFCGTPGYLAPEIIKEKPYNASVDFWSLGVLCFEMMCGSSPFTGDDEDELFKSILESELEVPSTISSGASAFLKGLLNRDAEQRLGCGKTGQNDIRSHPFFEDMSWEKAEARELKPPYCPTISNPKNAENFDSEYTDQEATLTPIDAEDIADIDQNLFHGFSFVSPKLFGMDGDSTAVTNTNKLASYAWYRPDLSRVDAVRMLKSLPCGAFIIRESGSQPGCFAMHVSLGDEKCWHGLITLTNKVDGTVLYKIYAKCKFSSLEELVDYYKANPISRSASGQKVSLDDSSLQKK